MQALASGAGIRLKCSGVTRFLRGLSFQVCSGLPVSSKELKLAVRNFTVVRHGLFHREPAVLDDGRGSIPGEEGGPGREGAREPCEEEKASEK